MKKYKDMFIYMAHLSHLKCAPVLPGKLQTIPAVSDDSDRKSDWHPQLIHMYREYTYLSV